MGSCFSRKSKQIKSKGTDSQLESQVVNCYENLETSLSPCYNGLGISIQILNSNKYSQDSIYQIFYRNVTRQQEDWCFVDENCVLQFDNFIGRWWLS